MFKQMNLIFVFNRIKFKKQQQIYVIFLKYANRFRKSVSFSAIDVRLFSFLLTTHENSFQHCRTTKKRHRFCSTVFPNLQTFKPLKLSNLPTFTPL